MCLNSLLQAFYLGLRRRFSPFFPSLHSLTLLQSLASLAPPVGLLEKHIVIIASSFNLKGSRPQWVKYLRVFSENGLCTLRLCPSCNVNFGPEHIGRFKVQISGGPGIWSGLARSVLHLLHIRVSRSPFFLFRHNRRKYLLY